MRQEWGAFVPRAGRRLLTGARDLPAVERADAVVVFADLAGFTALSEALAERGPAGAEAMRVVLDRCCTALVEQVEAAGGDLTTFAGDALSAVFPVGRAGRADAVRRALACALALQRALSAVPPVPTPRGPRPVQMKVGVGAGLVQHALVGDLSLRVLYVLAGTALDAAVAAQSLAQAGEVVASASLLDEVVGVEAARPRAAHCAVTAVTSVTSVTSVTASATGPDGSTPRTAGQQEEAELPSALHAPDDVGVLHPVLAARLATGDRVLVGEHRTVTSAFVTLPDLRAAEVGGAARLQGHVCAAVRSLDRFDGDLRQVEAGEAGCRLVLTFGAPRGHADDAERAVACCLDLLADGRGRCAGIATGQAFCGEVGGHSRRDYAVLGDSVNTAARLAARAQPQELLVDTETHRRVAGMVECVGRAPLVVKGKAQPVQAWSVTGLREPVPRGQDDQASAAAPFVGRQDALDRVSALLDAARSAGRVVAVTGEPGIGKSRLAGRVRGMAIERGWTCAVGACGSPSDQRGYLLWRQVVPTLLGVAGAAPEEVADVARRVLRGTGRGQDTRATLWGPVIGLPLDPADAEPTGSLDPRTRAELTRGLIVDLVLEAALDRPLLLVLEDCHWIDELSAGVLELLASSVPARPVLVLVVTRPEGRAVKLLERLTALPHATTLTLDGLDDQAARALLQERLDRVHGSGAVPPGLVDQLARRGAGNPLFLHELAAFAPGTAPEERDEGLVLPPDVQRLVVARLDALDPSSQAVLKAASVVGRQFAGDWVQGCLSRLGARPAAVAADLAQCVRAGMLRPSRGAEEASFEFVHDVLQEATYATLGDDARSALHEAVGSHVELLPETSRNDHVEVLAHHFARSRNVSKQRIWLRAAGDVAWAAYATDAAQEHYRRLLPLLSDRERPEVLVSLGRVWQLAGQWSDAERVLREAVATASAAADSRVLAAAHRELGVLLAATPSYDEGCRLLATAAEEFAGLGDDDGLLRTLDRWAFALFGRGDYTTALEVAERQMAGQTARGDLAGMSAAADNLGCISWMQGDYDRALALLHSAQDLAERCGDVRVAVHVANDLAGLCAERGDDAGALRHLQHAVSDARRIGYRELLVLLTSNAGELYRQRGQFDQARRCGAYALSRALELGAWLTVAHCLTSLAAGQVEAGAREVRPVLELAEVVVQRQDRPALLAEVLHASAVLAEREGRLADADALGERAEAAADRMQAHELHRQIQLLRMHLDVARGRRAPAAAVAELERLLAQCPDPVDAAPVLEALAQLGGEPELRDRAAALHRELYAQAPRHLHAAAFRRLTGESLPAPPLLPELDLDLSGPEPELDPLLERVARAVGQPWVTAGAGRSGRAPATRSATA